MRIAVAGLQHETNRFVFGVTGMEAFLAPGGWPPLSRGGALLQSLAGTSVPSAGALDVFADQRVELVPILWAMALPSGPVDHVVYADLREEIIAGLRAAEPVDGVFLELHGAMVTTREPDAEGDLLSAVRAAVGPSVPIVATLDLHGNLTERMVDAADWIEPYRTYPHVDMVQTGGRAADRLMALARGDLSAPACAYRPVPYMLPLIAQATEAPAMARLYAAARADERRAGIHGVQLTLGFPYADIAEAGPAIAVYAEDDATANRIVESHLAAWRAAEPDLAANMRAPDAAVASAMRGVASGGPIILADVQDNPGGGAPQDTTGLLHALIDAGAEGAVLVHICDSDAVLRAHEAGQGGRIDVSLGGRRTPAHGAPVAGPFDVLALGDGRFTGQGPMYRGNAIALGPVALLSKNGVRVIVAGQRMQASEPGLLEHLGLEPKGIPILAVKSSVHFRGAYQAMARDIILVEAPGAVRMALDALDFRHARRPPARTKDKTAHARTKTLTGEIIT